MTAPSPAGLSPLLDQLDEARATATPGPWATDERRKADVVNHKGFPVAYAVTTLDRDADAALIVAAVNALPQLVAAVRGVLQFADGWDLVADMWLTTADAASAADLREQAQAEAQWYRTRAANLRAALTAALTPGADTAGATA